MSNPIIPSTTAAPVSSPNTPTPAKTPVLNTSPSTPPKTDTPQEVRKLKLKIDNVETEMSENDVIALAQKGQGSEKRFQEAAQLRKEAEGVVKFLKENPREALKQFGIDVRKFSEDVLMEHLTEQALTPDQKNNRDRDAELKKYKDREQAETARVQKESEAKQEQEITEGYNRSFTEALEQSGLPKNAFTISRMAQLQMTANRKGYEIPPQELAKLVREDYMAEQKSLYSGVEGDKLLELLGPDIVKKLSKAQIAKLKAGQPVQTKVAPQKTIHTSAPSASKEATQSWRAFQKANRKPI